MATRVHMFVPFEGDDWIAQILDSMGIAYDLPYNQGIPAKVNYTSYLLSLLLDNWGGGSGGSWWSTLGNDNGTTTRKLGTTSNASVHITTNNATTGTWFKTGQWGIGLTDADTPLALLHVKGTGATNATSSFYTQNSSGTHSWQNRNDGSILRDGQLYSISENAGANTTWGRSAGSGLISGSGTNNSFFGTQAGGTVSTGSNNSVFGASAGNALTAASSNNSFFGRAAGSATTGDYNAFFGQQTGQTNITGTRLSFFGTIADASANNLTDAIALGYAATVTASHQFVIGSAASYITDMYIGEGVTSSTLHDFNFNRTNASGVNIDGADTYFNPSRASGSANTGDIIFQFALPGSSGSTLTSLTPGLFLQGTTGWIGWGGSPTALLDIHGSNSMDILFDDQNITYYLANFTSPAEGLFFIGTGSPASEAPMKGLMLNVKDGLYSLGDTDHGTFFTISRSDDSFFWFAANVQVLTINSSAHLLDLDSSYAFAVGGLPGITASVDPSTVNTMEFKQGILTSTT